MGDVRPWLVALPLLFAGLPPILIAGIVDRETDVSLGKNAVAGRRGNRTAISLALALAPIAFLLLLARLDDWHSAQWFVGLLFLHLVFLSSSLVHYLERGCPRRGQNRLLINSLAFLLWFPAAIFLRVIF